MPVAKIMLGVPKDQASKVDVNTGKTPEAGKEGETRGNTLPVEKDADPTMEQFAERVEQANIDKVPKVTHEALVDVMLGWKGG